MTRIAEIAAYEVATPSRVLPSALSITRVMARHPIVPAMDAVLSSPEAPPRRSSGTTSGMIPANAAPATLLPSWSTRYAATSVGTDGAHASSASPTRLIAVPPTIQGVRRPHRPDVRSLSAPATIGTSTARTPPAAVARPTTSSFWPGAVSAAEIASRM